MAVAEDIDNDIEEVIIPRMAFSAERNRGDGEEPEASPLGKYLRALTKKPPQHANQEFRTALTAEAVRNFETLWSAKGEKVWEEAVHQILRSWEDVQVYCYDHHRPCPDLPALFREGGAIPVEMEENALLYTQEYLRSAGWKGAGEEWKVTEEWEAGCDVRELLARPLVTFVESIVTLPEPLREHIAHRVREDGHLPHLEELRAWIGQHGVGDVAAHEAWLADRRTEAMHLLVLSNMRFAVHKARQCHGRGVDVDDLVQESALGLMKAAGKFEPHRGGLFVNFAASIVTKAIRVELAERSSVICRTRSVVAEIKELERCEGTLYGTLGRRPSPEELGEALSWSVETVKRVQRTSVQRIISLDAAIAGDEEGNTVGETLADPKTVDGSLEQGYHIILHDLLMEVLKGLPEREREIVVLRHGLGGGPPYTLQQAADILNITRQRVHQLESCGEARLIRIIARRFPQLLPDGMTPECAMELADRKDWGKAFSERKRKERVEAARKKTKGAIDTLATQGGEEVS